MTEKEKARTSQLSQHAKTIIWVVVLTATLVLILGTVYIAMH